MISLVAATLKAVGKQEIEGPTKDEKTMLLPLAQKTGEIIGRSSKQIQTELIEGLGNTYGFEMARKESNENWLMRVLHYMKVLRYVVALALLQLIFQISRQINVIVSI